MKKITKFIVFAILFPALIISTALLAYLHFFAANDKNLSGEWTASLDMTDQTAVTALGWLQDIEAVSVSMQDMESTMQGLNIEVQLTFEQAAWSGGTFQCSVLPESYDACNQAAYEAFALVFRELLAERLRMAGYAGSTDEEAVEALVTETFGMPTVSYLMTCGPRLLPSMEELQLQYDGSGTYQATGDILTRQFDDGGSVITKTEHYIRKDVSLILMGESDADPQGQLADDYPVIYTLQQSSGQE